MVAQLRLCCDIRGSSLRQAAISDVSRRQFLAAGGGALGAAWFAANVDEILAAGTAAAEAGREQPPTFRNLTAAQAADIEAFTAQIIPTDTTPGAREARVVHFIDIAIGGVFADRRGALMAGLRDLDARVRRAHGARARFATLTDAQQKAIVGATADADAPIFNILRALTINGMFASPEHGGNHRKVGWQLIGFQDRYSWAAPFGAYDR